MLVEDFDDLTLDEQEAMLMDAESIRQERDNRELYDLYRTNNDQR
jgi:hypothetical protein